MSIRPLVFATLVSAVLLTGARAEEPAAPPKDPAQRQRIYYAGDGHSFRSRVEFTEEGATLRFEGEVRLKARPMSAKEQALRAEYIANVPLGPGDLEPGPRQEVIAKILGRTNPLGVLRDVPQAVEAGFQSWSSPLRFDAIWLDQNHPVAAP